jgi:hypothetical protein
MLKHQRLGDMLMLATGVISTGVKTIGVSSVIGLSSDRAIMGDRAWGRLVALRHAV